MSNKPCLFFLPIDAIVPSVPNLLSICYIIYFPLILPSNRSLAPLSGIEHLLDVDDLLLAGEDAFDELAFGFCEFPDLSVHFEHLLLLLARLFLHCLIQSPQQRPVLLQQSPVLLCDRLPEGSEFVSQSYLLHSQPGALGLCGGDVVLEEADGGGETVHVGQGLGVLFLFVIADCHGGVETGEAFDDLGSGEEGDAFGVVVHDVLGQVGATLLSQAQFVEDALLRRRPVLLLNEAEAIFHSLRLYSFLIPQGSPDSQHMQNQSSRSLKKSLFFLRYFFLPTATSPSRSSRSLAFSFFLMPSMALRSSSSVFARFIWVGGSLTGICCCGPWVGTWAAYVISSACSQMLNFSLGPLLSSLFFLSGPSRSRLGGSSLGAQGFAIGSSLTAWAQGLQTGSLLIYLVGGVTSSDGLIGFSSAILKDGWQGLGYYFFMGSLSKGLQPPLYALGLGSTSVSLDGMQLYSASFFCRSLNLRLNFGLSSGTSILISFSTFFPSRVGALKGSSSLNEKLGAYYFFGSSFFGYSFFGYSFLGSSFLTSMLFSAVGTYPSSFFSILLRRLNLLGTKTGCSYSGFASAFGSSMIGFFTSSMGFYTEISFLLSAFLFLLRRMNLGPIDGFSSSLGY